MKKIVFICLVLLITSLSRLSAQHTFGVTGGVGTGSFRPYPTQETKSVGGLYSGGVSWRYYTAQKYMGCFGIDLEYFQRGFSFAPYTSSTNDEEEVDPPYYTRRINSLMLPILFQPHIYVANNRARIFMEAAVTFSYDLSSSYTNELAKEYGKEDWQGDYIYKTARDNRLAYGLSGGAGFAILVDQFEFILRARYFFGYSDVVRNRNKYYSNNLDGPENPFSFSPIRSPLDNINISLGVSYRLSKDGFDSWGVKRVKREKIGDGFNFDGKSRSNSNNLMGGGR